MRRACWLLVVAALGACSAPPLPPAEREIADGARLADAIVFRTGEDEPSEESPAGLTAAECVRLALTGDPRVQAALARVRAAQAEAHQARLLPNPVLSVALRFPEAGGSPVVEAGLAAELLSLVQQPGRVKAADHRLRAAGTEAVAVALEVSYEALRAYARAQAEDAALPLLEERQRLVGRLTELARRRLDAGEGIRLDVTTLEAQAAELEVERATIEVERRDARLALARVIGRPRDAAEWTLDLLPAATPIGDEAAWIAAALEHRPELRVRMWELAALGVESRLARWALLEDSEAGIDAERDGVWEVGPAIATPLPIFDWGQAKRKLAEANRVEAIHELTRVKHAVIEEVLRAHASAAALDRAAARVRDELIPLLERRRREADEIYTAGESDLTPLILADQDLQAALARLIELQHRAAEARIDLQHAVGGAGRTPMQPEMTEVSP